jgi:LmbE family N-acetylglucosaminyl deacetylase
MGVAAFFINAAIHCAGFIKSTIHAAGFHPRLWLVGVLSYSRYLGYIRPELLGSNDQEFRIRRQLLAKAWEPRRLEVPVGKRILALCPHPDDESIGAGGLLLAHRDIAEIHLICLCDGAGGGSLEHGDTSPDLLVKARRAEFQKTALELRAASVQHLNYSDGNIPCSPASVERLRSIVRSIRPDIVLIPWFLDGHEDHRRANMLYARACDDLEVMVLAYEIWSMLEPNALFDITAQLADKLALIRNYRSQLRTVDYLQYASGLARVRAYHGALRPLRSGAAEAFIALPNREYCDQVRAVFPEQPEAVQ